MFLAENSRSATFVVVGPGTPGELVVPVTGRLLVGRACTSALPHERLIVDDPLISREHAEFLAGASSETTITDLSTNGTVVNGRRIARGEPVNVRHGDAVVLGGLELLVRRPPPLSATADPVLQTVRALEVSPTVGPVVAGLGEAGRRRLVDEARSRTFERDEVLLRQGARGDSVLLVRRGTLKAIHRTGDRTTLIALNGPGDIVGELGVLDGGPRIADVVGLEHGEVLELSGDRFRAALQEVPGTQRRVNLLLSDRLRELTAHLVESSTLDVTGRMAARVLELADRYGRPRSDGTVEIDPRISRAELASWAGGSREAGARAMRALRDAGWVDTPGRLIVIRNRAALQQRAAA